MREIVGFVAGIAAGAAATVMATSETGRRLRERLLTEADPELRSALDEWDPLVREVTRAIRLATREIEEVVERAAKFVSEMSATEEEPAHEPAPSDAERSPTVDATSTGPAVPAVNEDVATQRAEPR